MSATELVDLFVRDYMASRHLMADITGHRRSDETESLEIKVTPRRPMAASMIILVEPFRDHRYGIYVFIGDDERPIEMVGPVNVNRPQGRPALEDLADVLDSVIGGEVYEEFDADGESLGCNIWDPERPLGADDRRAVSRQMFLPWE